MNEIYKRLSSFFIAFVTITIVFVYILRVPNIILNDYPGSSSLIEEYYWDTPLQTFVFDLILVAMYLFIAMKIDSMLSVHGRQFVITIFTTIILTTIFHILFKTYGSKGNFFTRWFKTVGNSAALYDSVIVGSVYILMNLIHY